MAAKAMTKTPTRDVLDAQTVREAVSVAVSLATLQTTQAEHERRISSLERFQYTLLFTSLSGAVAAVGTLILFVFQHFAFGVR